MKKDRDDSEEVKVTHLRGVDQRPSSALQFSAHAASAFHLIILWKLTAKLN